MNSLRVDGLSVWSSYGTGMGETIGMREARCCRHLGSHALSGWLVVGASWTAFPIAYIIPFTPSSPSSPLPGDLPLVTLA
jgi:hypothetical protein